MSGALTIVGLGRARRSSPRRLCRAHSPRQPTWSATRPTKCGFRSTAPTNAGTAPTIAWSRHALSLAAAGRRVAVVSSGDPGVFAMAAAVFEAIETGEERWRALDVRVEPGVTAMLAAAASAGAPLGADFCAISLSDNLKSWATIERRLEAAAKGDFVIALYNPASRARPHQLGAAFALLRQWKPADTAVVLAHAAGTDKALQVSSLGGGDALAADMRTLVLVGSRSHALRCARRRRRLGLYATLGGAAMSRPHRHEPGICCGASGRRMPDGFAGRRIITTGKPFTRSGDLAVGRRATRVLRHDNVDAALAQQLFLGAFIERSALQVQLNISRDIRRGRHVDAAHQISVHRRGLEHGDLSAADREQHALRSLPKALSTASTSSTSTHRSSARRGHAERTMEARETRTAFAAATALAEI